MQKGRCLPELQSGRRVCEPFQLSDDDVAGPLVDLPYGAAPAAHILHRSHAAFLQNLVPLNVLFLVGPELRQRATFPYQRQEPVEDVMLQLLLGVANYRAVAYKVNRFSAHPLEQEQRVVGVVRERERRGRCAAQGQWRAHDEHDQVWRLGVDLLLRAFNVLR
ncbi:hydrolase family protein, putative [Babesia ovata]|uniref:Hydrolase family protein, putative n=1 Tax=Babesia ovata TaxID=189622 RepID=A0A2H6K9S8_9APIC|nr:hydrolase family protein, putative [Babesia ovata]GBE59746.1 hydrolase family protein, putative [Babesia ovata]